jgi:hypothetical protein
MKLCESFYVDGRAVGMIVQDSMSGAVAFVPKEGLKPPPKRAWRNVDELKAAISKTYKSESPR